MHWTIKAALQKFLSLMPAGSGLYYQIFQRRITRSLPSSDHILEREVGIASKHLENFLRYCECDDLAHANLFEFGVGWDLMIPLAYYYLGARHQTIIDVVRGARPELVADSMKRLSVYLGQENRGEPDWGSGQILSSLNHIGINYLAPYDVKNTDFEPESFDLITNTSVLEHVPVGDLGSILKECFRIHKQGGVMSCLVNMRDHYSSFDKSISDYNFLKFSPPVWKLVNSSLMFQNRLRYPDYINLIRQAGFNVIAEEVRVATQDDIDVLKHLQLADEFRNYSLKDLGIKDAWIVLKRDR